MDKEMPKISNENNNKLLFFESKDIKFIFQPTIDKFFTKFLNYSTENYVFHSQINISNEEEKSFIFLTKSHIVLTQVFNHEIEDFKENPILFKIDYSQVINH
jgi:hypothetical protein